MARSTPVDTSELAQIKVLRAGGLSFRSIGRRLKRDHKTIKRATETPEMAPQIERVKVALADRFEDVAVRMLVSITDKSINGINAYQRTIAAAASVDKMRLLRDQSTQNVGIHAIVERIERARRKRLDRGRQKEAPQEGEE